jgi:hypothetical protein
VYLQRVHGRPGRPLAPEGVDQPVARHHLAAGDQQAGEQRDLLGRRRFQRAGAGGDLQGPEDADLHGAHMVRSGTLLRKPMALIRRSYAGPST